MAPTLKPGDKREKGTCRNPVAGFGKPATELHEEQQ